MTNLSEARRAAGMPGQTGNVQSSWSFITGASGVWEDRAPGNCES